jgi:hypothetical protein
MKFIAIENLSKKEISAILKSARRVSFTLSTKFVNESKWNKFDNILPQILTAGFIESDQEVGNFGSTKFFTKS